MINWLQTVLEKHLKWLFILLLFIVIISFVATIGAVPGLGEPETKVHKQSFYGLDLNDPKTVAQLQKTALLSQIMGTAPTSLSMGGEESLFLSRAALIHLANTLDIPSPTEETLTAYLQNDVPLFKNEKGIFDSEIYKKFIDWTHNTEDLGKGLAKKAVDEDYRIHQVLKLISHTAILPYEAEYQMALAKTKWTIDLATLDQKDLPPLPSPNDEELEAFYNANSFRYTLPEERSLLYVVFELKHYKEKLPQPTEEELKAFYENNALLFQKKLEDGRMEVIPFKFVDRKTLEGYYEEDKAFRLASEAGENMVIALYEEGIPQHSEAFEKLLHKNELTVQSIPAFSKSSIPGQAPFSRAALGQAFLLDSQQYFSDLLPTPQGPGIYFLESIVPAHNPSFEQVRKQVEKDYIHEQLRKQLSEEGKHCYERLKNANLSEKAFIEVAEAEKLSINSYDEFDLENPPSAIPGEVLMELPKMSTGSVTPMITLSDKGYFLYLRGKIVPNEDNAHSDEIKTQLREIQEITDVLNKAQFIQELILNGLNQSKN